MPTLLCAERDYALGIVVSPIGAAAAMLAGLLAVDVLGEGATWNFAHGWINRRQVIDGFLQAALFEALKRFVIRLPCGRRLRLAGGGTNTIEVDWLLEAWHASAAYSMRRETIRETFGSRARDQQRQIELLGGGFDAAREINIGTARAVLRSPASAGVADVSDAGVDADAKLESAMEDIGPIS